MDHVNQEIMVNLISEIDQLTDTTKGVNTKKSIQLPTPYQLYRIGGVLSEINSHNQQNQEVELVRNAYQQIVLTLPRSYFGRCFWTFQNAMKVLTNRVSAVATASTADDKDIASLFEAVHSLRGLLSNSEEACQIAYSTDFVSILALIHDQTLRLESLLSSSHSLEVSQREILQCLSHLLVDGCLAIKLGNKSDNERHEQQPIEQRIMHALQAMEEQSTDTLSLLLEWQEQYETPHRRLEHALLESHKANSILTVGEGDTTQLEYVIQMLETARLDQSRRKQSAVDQSHSKQPRQVQSSLPSKPVSAADELDRRIDQVQQVLPDLGAGFIETALSYYQGNVEQTVGILLSGVETDLPQPLRLIDRQLPRRQKQSKRSKDDAESAAEAKQIVKDRVALEQQREQERYKALLYVSQEERQQQQQKQQASGLADGFSAMFTHAEMMYDDDVDDQYDDIDGGLGGADSGWYDFEKVKLYNQAVKDEEADQLFWEENRNTNRPAKKSNGNNNNTQQGEGQGKQYRGPDKIKGGRIIGPDGKVVKNSGGRGRKQQQQRRQANISNNAAAAHGGSNGPSQQQPKKPKTKPKSNNRVNQRRDRKQKAQGTFGVND